MERQHGEALQHQTDRLSDIAAAAEPIRSPATMHDYITPAMSTSGAVLRREDTRFVTGHGRYTDDIHVDGQAYAVFVRSDHAHGELVSIDIAEASRQPGVLGVFTGDDLLQAKVGFIHRLPLKGFELGNPLDTPRPGLAQGRVRYVGEPVAMVVAETAAQAADAAGMIKIEINPLPAVVDVERAVAPGAPVIWSDAPDNVAIRWQSCAPGAVDEAFAGAAHVTRLKLVNTRIFANPIEPRTSIAQYDAASGSLYLDHAEPGRALHGPRLVRSGVQVRRRAHARFDL